MSMELKMLTLTAGLTVVLWLPYMLAHIANVGLMPALTYGGDATPLAGWAARAKKAHYNAIENLAPFAALVIIAELVQATGEATAMSAAVYFWARVAHYVLYTANVPFGRTLSFAAGWAAMLCIFWQIMTVTAM